MKLEDAKRSLLAAHDMKLVKALAGNNPNVRTRALKNLKKWFEHRSLKIPFNEEEFTRIWKGLFYAMWMSDKPLVQEECAERISELLHFPNVETSLLFFRCSLLVLTTEWFGIDQLRLDKFLMFVRRLLRQSLVVLKNNNWQLDSVAEFNDILSETVLQNDNSNHIGLTMHIIEIYLEELAKVSKGEFKQSLTTEFLKPFIKQLATLDDARLIAHMKRYLFHHLLHQSDTGIEYQTKFQAWKGEGFPGGTIDSMQNVRDVDDDDDETAYSDDNVDNQPLDPRAGEVDVILPQLKFNGKEISKLLLEFKFVKGSTSKARNALTDLAKKFRQLSKGNFPLGIKKIHIPDEDGYALNIRKSVNRLVKFEKQLLGNNHKRKLKASKSEIDSSPPPPPSKKMKVDKTNLSTNSSDFFQKKLENFIKKSEAGRISHKKERKLVAEHSKTQSSNGIMIRRNSGTWLIESLDSSVCDHNSIDATSPNKSKHLLEVNCIDKSTHNFSDMAFPQNEWDFAPKDGEVEIFVPANKYKRKIENIAKKTGKTPSLLLKKSLEKLVKPRYSLDSALVKNPFSQKKVATSEKKVKINLRLNKSQEVSEHRAQIRQSPAIPFDANKKPIKPLLKSSFSSPINPFCKTKLF